MIKSVFMLCSADLPNELTAFERWLLRYHAPEVMSKDAGLQVRFISYRPIPVILYLAAYGYYNLRGIAVWFRSAGELPELEVFTAGGGNNRSGTQFYLAGTPTQNR